MAKDGKASAVISVRITEDEQARLRSVAEARGTTVSALVRDAALREGQARRNRAVVVTTGQADPSPPVVGEGVFWEAPSGAQISGNTLTWNARRATQQGGNGAQASMT